MTIFEAGSTSARVPMRDAAHTALTHAGWTMYASSSRRRYSTFSGSNSMHPARVASPLLAIRANVRYAVS